MLHYCTLQKHGSCLHLQDAALFNQAVPYALSKVGKPGMVLRTNNRQQYSSYIMARMCFYGCIRPGQIYLWGLTVCRKDRSGVSLSTDFEIETMASPDAGVVYFTEYLSVLFQLTYLDELYGECNGTARACVNSGYQALFSPITEHLGTRLHVPANMPPILYTALSLKWGWDVYSNV